MFNYFGIFDLGTPELVIILFIILLLFGGRKLPELSRSIGESLRELRKGADMESDNDTKKDEKSVKK